MNENSKIKDYNELKDECAPVFYKEVEKFFAKGMIVVIDEQLDIIKVALTIQNDDNNTMEKWIEQSLVVRALDDHAIKWNKTNEPLMAITAIPWVLVQEISD